MLDGVAEFLKSILILRNFPLSHLVILITFLFFFFLRYLFIYLFIYERHRENSRDIGRRRSRLLTGSLMWDLILDPGIMT